MVVYITPSQHDSMRVREMATSYDYWNPLGCAAAAEAAVRRGG
jgi:hypothetical protein